MAGVQVLKLKLEELILDTRFQRPLNEKFVDKIVSEFDEKQLGVLVCNKRFDGNYALIDGQHRYHALLIMERKTAQAVVFEMDAMDEGKLFVALQKNRRPVTAIEQHRVLVNSKDELAVKIDRITNRHGFKIDSSSIGCIQRIRYVSEHRGWKLEDYGAALNTIHSVWGTDNPEARKLPIVMGMWMLYHRGDLRVTREAAIDAFMPLDPRMVAREAKIVDADNPDMGSMGATAWVLAQHYNKHNKLRGTQKIERYVFTNSFRTKLGNVTHKARGVNTGDSSANEYTSPLSSGESEE